MKERNKQTNKQTISRKSAIEQNKESKEEDHIPDSLQKILIQYIGPSLMLHIRPLLHYNLYRST